MASQFSPASTVAPQRLRFGAAAVIHELNDPKRNPIPRAERRKAERAAKNARS